MRVGKANNLLLSEHSINMVATVISLLVKTVYNPSTLYKHLSNIYKRACKINFYF
jgi:hypothetical protein